MENNIYTLNCMEGQIADWTTQQKYDWSFLKNVILGEMSLHTLNLPISRKWRQVLYIDQGKRALKFLTLFSRDFLASWDQGGEKGGGGASEASSMNFKTA